MLKAGRLKDGTGRQKQTQMVNAFLVRDSQGRLVQNLDHPMFKQMDERRYTKCFDESTKGSLFMYCIVCVACVFSHCIPQPLIKHYILQVSYSRKHNRGVVGATGSKKPCVQVGAFVEPTTT